MKTATKICKVCGKEYPYCRTIAKAGTFRYQDVACCPEHASQYFAEVEAARSGKDTIKSSAKKAASKAKVSKENTETVSEAKNDNAKDTSKTKE